MRAAGNDAEFGLQVDLAAICGCEVEEKPSGVIDKLRSFRVQKARGRSA